MALKSSSTQFDMDNRYLKSVKITPVVLVVDISGSMSQMGQDGITKMSKINDGIKLLIETIKSDASLSNSIELAIVTYGNNAALYTEFTFVNNYVFSPINYSNESGDTPEGVKMALNLIDKEVDIIKSRGGSSHRGWVFIFSDGVATIGGNKSDPIIKQKLWAVSQETRTREKNQQLNVIPVYITVGTSRDREREQMKSFSSNGNYVELNNNDRSQFQEFFKLLPKSVSSGNAGIYQVNNINDNVDLNRSFKVDEVEYHNFGNSADVQEKMPNVAIEINEHGDKVHVNETVNSDAHVSHPDVGQNNKTEMFSYSIHVKLPEPLKNSELLKISFNEQENANDGYVDLFSDSGEMQISGTDAVVRFEHNESIPKLWIYVGLHENNNNRDHIKTLFKDTCFFKNLNIDIICEDPNKHDFHPKMIRNAETLRNKEHEKVEPIQSVDVQKQKPVSNDKYDKILENCSDPNWDQLCDDDFDNL